MEFLTRRLRDHWGQGEPPSGFGVIDPAVMVFRVRNPNDTAVWHHYSLDLRDIEALPDDLAPAVVTLHCLEDDRCIRQQMCRSDECFDGDSISQQKWFFEDGTQGRKVIRAFDHLIDLAVRRFPSKNRIDDLF